MSGRLVLRGALQSICRSLPLYSGTGRIANSRLFSALAGDTLVHVQTSDGSTVIVDPRDMLGRSILYFGHQDPKISWVFRRVLRPGDLVVDVGANIGALSIMAARAVGSMGRVLSVEPQPDLVERIRVSCTLNNIANVEVYPVGLSDADRTAKLSVPANNSGYGSLQMQYGPAESGRSVDVPLRHAGAFLTEAVGVGPLRLLKIDVEGHEAEVMRGARSWLESHLAEFVLFEVGAGKAFWSREEVSILADLGYKFLGVPHVAFKMRLVPLPHRTDMSDLDIRDVLAYHESADVSCVNQ
jgi:FkbM family methyltransferase